MMSGGFVRVSCERGRSSRDAYGGSARSKKVAAAERAVTPTPRDLAPDAPTAVIPVGRSRAGVDVMFASMTCGYWCRTAVVGWALRWAIHHNNGNPQRITAPNLTRII